MYSNAAVGTEQQPDQRQWLSPTGARKFGPRRLQRGSKASSLPLHLVVSLIGGAFGPLKDGFSN
jgi:hypothetical protein